MQYVEPLSVSSVRTSTNAPDNKLDLLRQHDDPVFWDAPSGYQRTTALKAFRTFVAHLEEALGHRVDYDTFASDDDARFHGEIFLPGGSLRFSNFGRMIAFAEPCDVATTTLRLVAKLAPQHGYTLIESELLDTRYNGRHPRGRGQTWRERFFG
jgi:hypothetical protein